MEQNDIEIRLARPEEAKMVASVLEASFAEYEMLYTPEGFRATVIKIDGVQQRMEEGPLWVALKGNNIVGTAAALAKGRTLYIRGMAVLPSARGLAIGKRLLRAIEEFARAADFDSLLLSTTPFLAQAIALYERYGFSPTEGGPSELFGTPLFSMEKRLN